MELIAAGVYGPAHRPAGYDSPVLTLDETAAALADVRTVASSNGGIPQRALRLIGRVEIDEDAPVATIAAYFPGRVERLFVDATGIPRAGRRPPSPSCTAPTCSPRRKS